MGNGQDEITQLKRRYGVSDAAIGGECGMSREHITRIRTGKRQASPALIAELQGILSYCDETNYKPERKPYTWKKKPVTRPVPPAYKPAMPVTRSERTVQAIARQVQPERTVQAQPARASKSERCERCGAKDARPYTILGGAYCDGCARGYGQIPPTSGL
jgi:transcriptional regulator with XRE-family HTH domain